MKSSSWIAVVSLYLIAFIDLGGLSLTYIFFAPMILDSTSAFLPYTASEETRQIILAILYGSYPFTQLFGAPIFGELSDRLGRKKILLVTALLTGVGFMLSGVAIMISSLWLLLASRLFAGLFAGNLTVAQAAVVDIVPKKSSARFMTMFASVGGLSWTLLPTMGVLLGKVSFSFPFWCVGLVFCVICAILWKFLPKDTNHTGEKIHLGESFTNLVKVFAYDKVAYPLTISIVLIMAWMVYQSYFSPFLLLKYHMNSTSISYAFTFSSFCWMSGGLFANLWLVKRFSPGSALIIPQIVSAIGIFSIALVQSIPGIYIASGIGNLLQSAGMGCFFALFPFLESHNNLGKVFGCWNAGFALGSALGPLVAGGLATYSVNLPSIFSGTALFIPMVFYLYWYFKKGRKQELESDYHI